ncbi:MAG: cardiolipin synthase [Muribaculaceae bacterium]|nr:cardiolipin synthase [Muribaculaceae bacterium]
MHWIAENIDMAWVWWILNILYALTILGIIAVVVSENRNPVKSLAWVTVLLVVPVVGLVLYIVFGRNIQNKRIISRRNRRKLRRLGAGGGTDPAKIEDAGAVMPQINLAYALCGSHYYEGNDVGIFDNGQEKFDALLADIAAARSYINMQYYIIVNDNIGIRVMEALMERARAGVKVRLIYDHVGSFKLSNRYLRRLKEAGVEAYPFFKVVFPPFGTRINWRNHRKIVVIDGKVGYIGGMNVADRYVDGGKLFDVWRDLHLRVEGPAVFALQQSFAVDWNFMGQPLLEEGPLATAVKGHSVGMQLVTGGPTTQWLNMTLVFQQAIARARKCIYIQTPYFIPSEGLVHALQVAALSKVDVRLMIPRRSDSDMLRWASFSYVQECLRAGIKVYLYEKGMLHSKAIIIDDDFCTVGSTNFDFRSFEHNFEANMLIYSTDFNARMKALFVRDMRDSRRVTSSAWRHRPWREKALESVMRLFSPIL